MDLDELRYLWKVEIFDDTIGNCKDDYVRIKHCVTQRRQLAEVEDMILAIYQHCAIRQVTYCGEICSHYGSHKKTAPIDVPQKARLMWD